MTLFDPRSVRFVDPGIKSGSPLSVPDNEHPSRPTQVRRNWFAGLLARRDGRLWLLFGPVYQRLLDGARERLRPLPRRKRRRWLDRMGATLAGMALIASLAQAGNRDARANAILVADGAVEVVANDVCSLIEAIENANDVDHGAVHDDCAAGDPAGVDVVSLPAGGGFLLKQPLATYYDSPTGLPLVESAIVIEGNGATIGRQAEEETKFRLLAVSSSGDLTLNHLTLEDGYALGSYGGGAVLNNGGEVVITGTELTGNTAARAGGAIYNASKGALTINGSTLAGNIAAFGGGVSTYGGYLTIEGSQLLGNQASSGGGGVHAIVIGPPPQPRPPQDTVTLLDTLLDGNTAETYGGGVYVFSTSATIISSTFRNNVAGDNGGGVDFHTDNSHVTIEDSTFVGNHSYDNGGGISSVGASMAVVNSTVQGNTAAFGGGLYAGASAMSISGTTVSGNSALLAGGGIRTLAGSNLLMTNSTVSGNVVTSPVTFAGGFNHHTSAMTLTNSTVTANSAAEFGGGVRNFEGTAMLQRNLIAGNSAATGREVDNLDGTLNADSFNLFGYEGDAGVNGFVPGPTDIVPLESLAEILSPTLAGNEGTTFTHTLVASSPAVDAAPSDDCLAPPVGGVDQRGRPRNADGDGRPSANECDVGAFELQAAGPQPTPTSAPSPTPTATPPPTPQPGAGYFLPVVLDE